MTDITLALPFALPPVEMAPHLVRALQTPALAALLSRYSTLERHVIDHRSRVLPHEAWLAHQLGFAPDTGAPLAAACMRGCGLQAQASQGRWLIVQPAHIQVSSTHPSLADPRTLQLTDEESQALYASARPYFEELGKPLLYGGPDLWFMRADDWAQLSTASTDLVINQNLGDWLPGGEPARAYRRLQNEIQMLWHEHPVNLARAARGLPVINFWWSWGGADASVPSSPLADSVAVAGGPAWMQALAAPALRQCSVTDLLAAPGERKLAVIADLIPSGQAGEWAEWIALLQRIDSDWCAPLLAALQEGRVRRVSLLLSHRDGWLHTASSRLSHYQFWRKPSLNILTQAL